MATKPTTKKPNTKKPVEADEAKATVSQTEAGTTPASEISMTPEVPAGTASDATVTDSTAAGAEADTSAANTQAGDNATGAPQAGGSEPPATNTPESENRAGAGAYEPAPAGTTPGEPPLPEPWPAPPAVLLTVVGPKTGRWRAGRNFGPEGVEIDVAAADPEHLRMIAADPALTLKSEDGHTLDPEGIALVANHEDAPEWFVAIAKGLAERQALKKP